MSKKLSLTTKIVLFLIIISLFCIIIFYMRFPFYRAYQIPLSCSLNLKHIYLAALQHYAADYAGYYPPANGATGLEVLRKNDYLTDYVVYTCPGVKKNQSKDGQPLTEEYVDYVYIGGLNTKSDPNLPILYDKPNNHDNFGNVLFVDGSVNKIKGESWTQNIRK